MNVEILFTYKDAIAAGILMTLKMSLGGILLGLAIGLCFFLLERQKPALFNVIYHAWINVFRGTPLLVQLFLVFYGGPYIGINHAWDVMVPLILRKYFVRVAMLSQVGKLKRRQTWG
ncbi:ABC transporter permease subunit [Klebsiella pneumoniae]|uniref:ABC transporter permease subunit n=1 Tax=Klebsiella pneumoniae TaxID=573 RepID=UPI003EE0FD99